MPVSAFLALAQMFLNKRIIIPSEAAAAMQDPKMREGPLMKNVCSIL
jgi:hypothetical protein